MITLDQYWMGRDKAYPDQVTDEIRNNAIALLREVNALLMELGVEEVTVSSGFRPSVINKATPNAATHSLHMIGKAIDILDHQHVLYDKILAKSELLEKYSLWAEDKSATPGWLHLDTGQRSSRSIRTFLP